MVTIFIDPVFTDAVKLNEDVRVDPNPVWLLSSSEGKIWTQTLQSVEKQLRDLKKGPERWLSIEEH